MSRRTVARWRAEGRRRVRRRRPQRPAPSPWRPPCRRTYAYALGLYLGDGYVAPVTNPFLQIYLDTAYPSIIAECRRALTRTFEPSVARSRVRRDTGVGIVQLSSAALPAAFPQHGPGKKHERPIRLARWQRAITEEHPEAFLRGMIHSDGCRAINCFEVVLESGPRRYSYPRYFFSNLSADIRRLFCEHCELLGIRWTQSNPRNISVSHRDSVALLDEFVGPKR